MIARTSAGAAWQQGCWWGSLDQAVRCCRSHPGIWDRWSAIGDARWRM